MGTHVNGSTDPANPTQISTLLLVGNSTKTFEVGPTQTGPTYFAYNPTLAALGTTTITTLAGANVVVNAVADVAANLILNVSGDSSINVDSVVGVLGAVTAHFSFSGGTLGFTPAVLSVLTAPPVVTGFATGDQITFNSNYDTTGTNTTVYNATTGQLTLFDNGTAEGAVFLSPAAGYTQADFNVVDIGGKAEIVGCFLRGTRILTAHGEVAVETLRVGDLVMTLSNGLKKVVSVKLRSFVKPAQLASSSIRPVRIAAGALADNVPSRELCVSPDHAMYLDGVLVPASALVNGETITQPTHYGVADYFHVEVELHDILIAEGAAAESYLDIGNGQYFGQPGVITLFPVTEPKTWEDACAPLLLGGPQLNAIQATLRARAAAMALPLALPRVA